jgi:hypothetical protein
VSQQNKEPSAWQRYKEKNGVTPLDLVNPNAKHADLELHDKRYSICLSCTELIKMTKQCKQCGCFMNIKTKLLDAKCPIGKW